MKLKAMKKMILNNSHTKLALEKNLQNDLVVDEQSNNAR